MHHIHLFEKRGGIDNAPSFAFLMPKSLHYSEQYIMVIEHKIESLILEKCQEPDFQDCFLLEISISTEKAVEIIMDADSGLTLEKCQKISRHVENWLDTEGVLGEAYTIEVSSPGLSRPLALPRQFTKNIGRGLDVMDTEGAIHSGELTQVTETGIVLKFESVRKEGKKKIKEMVETALPFANIKQALVQIKF